MAQARLHAADDVKCREQCCGSVRLRFQGVRAEDQEDSSRLFLEAAYLDLLTKPSKWTTRCSPAMYDVLTIELHLTAYKNGKYGKIQKYV